MIADTVNVSSFIPRLLSQYIRNKNEIRFSFSILEKGKKKKKSAAGVHAEIYVCTASTHVHTLLSDLVSSAELQTVSFIMVKRMCAGHSDSFTCADIELGSTLMVFLATCFFFFFFKQSLSDSLGGAVDVGCVMLCIVFNLLSHYMPY